MDNATIADRVSSWPGLGITLPGDVAEAIALFEVVRWIEVGYAPVFDLAEVTAQNAESKLREYAAQRALSDVPGGGLSALAKAKKDAVEAAAREVVGLARHAIPAVIEQLTPTFDQHVAAYVEATNRLPAVITADTLLSSGPQAVEAYQAAQLEARQLARFDAWVAQTGDVAGAYHTQGGIEVVCRVLTPASIQELSVLDTARHKPADGALQALDPVYFAAARNGIAFGIKTLREAGLLRQSLETIHPQKIQGVATLR